MRPLYGAAAGLSLAVCIVIACQKAPTAPEEPGGTQADSSGSGQASAQAMPPVPVPVPGGPGGGGGGVPGGPGTVPVPGGPGGGGGGGNVPGGPGPIPVPGGPGGPTGGPTTTTTTTTLPGPTPTPTATPTPPNPVVTTIVSVASGRPYQVVHDGMVSGAQIYIDRPEFTITGVFGPEQGFELIRTAFADGTAPPTPFLTLNFAEQVGVIMVMPGRDPRPAWFNRCSFGAPPIGCWEHTGRGWTLRNANDPNYFDVPVHELQVFPAGTMTVGGRGGVTTSEPQMYFLAVFPCRLRPGSC
jgi:hypothetical protein